MAETLVIVSERVDDIPLLVAQLDRMGVQPLLDKHFPTHGNWMGLSLGWVTVVWLTHILSEADHRLNHVAPWAQQRLHTLRECTGQPVHPLDVGDDRLATVLEAVSDDTRWRAFEGALNQYVLRVYDLQPACVRLDSTTVSGYWSVTADGLFQVGPSKDHRPDLVWSKKLESSLTAELMTSPSSTLRLACCPLHQAYSTPMEDGTGGGGKAYGLKGIVGVYHGNRRSRIALAP